MIYISYSHRDQNFVTKMTNKLLLDKYDLYFTPIRLESDESIFKEINGPSEKAYIFIVVLSSNSCESKWVRQEVNSHLYNSVSEDGGILIPIVIDKCNISPFLKEKYQVNFYEKKYNEAISQLKYDIIDQVYAELATERTVFNQKKVNTWNLQAERARLADGTEAGVAIFEEAVRLRHSPLLWKHYIEFAAEFCSNDIAKGVYERAYKEFDNSDPIISSYSKFLISTNDLDRCQEIISRVIELGPMKKTKYHFMLAEIHEIRNDFENARKEYKKITSYSPNNAEAWKCLANLERKISKTLKVDLKDSIRKSIEFPQEYYQTGISILNYFNTILNQKYPDIEASVTIKQEGLNVTMIIETNNGEKEIIEKALTDYGLVVTGRMNASTLLQNSRDVVALENKLELLNTELRMTNRLLESERNQYSQRINSLEKDIERLNNIVLTGLSHNQTLQELIGNHLKTNDTSVNDSLALLKTLILKGAAREDEDDVLKSLDIIADREPSLMGQIVDLVFKGAISGSSGNMLYQWIISFCNAMPK